MVGKGLQNGVPLYTRPRVCACVLSPGEACPREGFKRRTQSSHTMRTVPVTNLNPLATSVASKLHRLLASVPGTLLLEVISTAQVCENEGLMMFTAELFIRQNSDWKQRPRPEPTGARLSKPGKRGLGQPAEVRLRVRFTGMGRVSSEGNGGELGAKVLENNSALLVYLHMCRNMYTYCTYSALYCVQYNASTCKNAYFNLCVYLLYFNICVYILHVYAKNLKDYRHVTRTVSRG